MFTQAGLHLRGGGGRIPGDDGLSSERDRVAVSWECKRHRRVGEFRVAVRSTCLRRQRHGSQIPWHLGACADDDYLRVSALRHLIGTWKLLVGLTSQASQLVRGQSYSAKLSRRSKHRKLLSSTANWHGLSQRHVESCRSRKPAGHDGLQEHPSTALVPHRHHRVVSKAQSRSRSIDLAPGQVTKQPTAQEC